MVGCVGCSSSRFFVFFVLAVCFVFGLVASDMLIMCDACFVRDRNDQ